MKMKFTAAGDAIIQQKFDLDYYGAKELKEYICKGDARFFNLETTLNKEGECYASQFSGGSYLRANPDVLECLAGFGFNMTSFANNHSFDFSYGGFLKTLETVNEYGFANAGCGIDMPSAAKAAYLNTDCGVVALISVCSTFEPSAMAGNPTDIYKGRPGINGLRFEEKITVTREQMQMIRKMADETNINAEKNIEIKEGYYPSLPQGKFDFGSVSFEEGEKTSRVTSVNKKDMNRILCEICKAKEKADYIIISVHSHEIEGAEKENPADFLVEFAHSCIDGGANAVIGHGPHLIRAVEVYKNSPIFYSLGDFVLQLNSIPSAPAEFYEKNGLTPEATVEQLLNKRSKNNTIGLMCERKMFESFVPYWETENGKLTQLELMPIELGFELKNNLRGVPKKADSFDFVERLKKISQPYNTKFATEDGVIRVML